LTRILLTGSGGQIGNELKTALAPLGELMACDRKRLDLTDSAAMLAAVREFRPTIIVNAAAYTAVDRAESEPDLALLVNGIAPGILAEEARRLDAMIVHYSTDYVFDGSKDSPYTEDDAPNPLSAYGRSKLAGDRAVQTSGAKHLILRTSWVYGATGKNFLLTIRRLAREREELRIVNDQFGAPTWSREIATATAGILTRVLNAERTQARAESGIFNVTAQGRATWHEFATAIIDATSAPRARSKTRVVPIPASEYPTPAIRPRNSVLSHVKLRRIFALELPDWRASVSKCLAEAR